MYLPEGFENTPFKTMVIFNLQYMIQKSMFHYCHVLVVIVQDSCQHIFWAI